MMVATGSLFGLQFGNDERTQLKHKWQTNRAEGTFVFEQGNKLRANPLTKEAFIDLKEYKSGKSSNLLFLGSPGCCHSLVQNLPLLKSQLLHSDLPPNTLQPDCIVKLRTHIPRTVSW